MEFSSMSVMTASQLATQIREARQLLKLREIRKEAARREQEACLRAVDDAASQVRALQQRVEHAQVRLEGTVRWMHGEAAASRVRLHTRTNAAIDEMAADRERVCAALLGASRQLDAAQSKAQAATRRHSVACASVQVIDGLLQRLLAFQVRDTEHRLEREVETGGRSRLLAIGALQRGHL
jgi:hypothetical protein